MDKKQVDVTFDNGVLTIMLPKSAESKRKKATIEIK
ncbi:Hsp20 family protein [Desulfofustis limnaeus]